MVGPNPPQQNDNRGEQRLREVEELLKKKESELQERDRTVQELTDRLSQTVERLDRVKRGGSADNVIRMATFPKEVVDQQTELVADLKRAVELWETMQLSCGLGEFETKVADLYALFEEHFRPPEPEEPEAEEPEENQEPEEFEENEDPSLTDAAESSTDETLDSLDDIPEDLRSFPEEEELLRQLDEMCPPRPPEILNLTEADEHALRRCVEQQNTYIDYLSARLQRASEKKTSVDWEGLEEDPEKLKSQLEHTLRKIQQSKHFAEFELALQRTRLKRKEHDLKLLSEELESEMQNLNLTGSAPGTKDDTPNGQRWLRMLGVGKKE